MLRARLIFRPDKAGVAQLVRGPKIGNKVNRAATAGAKGVRNAAPYRSGAFRKSIAAQPARLTVRGWVARVITTDPFWHLEEFGSINNPPHRSFERGIRSAGIKYRDRRG